MANARLWWNGSTWVTSDTNCFTKKGGTSSSYANTNVSVNVAAYDNFTVRLTLTCKASYDARPTLGAICWGTLTAKSGSTTIVTQTWTENQAALTRSIMASNVEGYAKPITCSFNVNAQSSDGYGGNQNTSYSLNYTSPFFTITYNANGGSGAPASQTALKDISTVLSNTVPVRDGYTFLGWDTNQSATTATYNGGDSISISANTTLYAVWKAELSTVSADDGAIGVSQNITITQQGSVYSYSHTLKWTVNGTTGTIASGITGQSASIVQAWTPPATIVPLYTDRASYPCTITCETYNGGSLLGSRTITINLAVPNDYAPTFTSKTIDRTSGTYPTGCLTWVAGRTTPQFYGVVSPKQNATIVSWKYTVNGVTTTITDSSTTKTWTGAPVTSGTLTMVVTDSRGLTVSHTATVAVSSYSPPQMSNLVLTRALSDGTIDGQGTYLLATADISITALGDSNVKSYSVEYREEGSVIWQVDGTGTIPSYTGAFSHVSSTAILNQSKTYEARLVISDYYEQTIAGQSVSTANAIMDWKGNGLGVGIGKVSQTDYAVELESGWFLDFDGETFTKADATYVDGLPALIGSTTLPTTAQDITGAIDEIYGDVDDVATDVSNLQGDVSTLQTAVAGFHNIYVESVSMGSVTTSSLYKVVTKSVAKTGYTPVGIVGFDLGNTYAFVSKVDVSGTNAELTFRKSTSGEITVTPYVWVLYTKN